MKVKDYVQTMIKKLEEEGHREVEFLSASDCTLVRNGIRETYLIDETNPNETCYEINLHEIESETEVKGCKVRIFSIPKNKRKGNTLTFYVALKTNKV